MEEIWKDVANYEGKYMVSNYGRVKSLSYRKQKGVERILKMFCAKNGYCKLYLTKKDQFLTHRLVAMNFIGDVTNLVVNHKDFNKHNNHVSNLEIVTSAENTLHYHLDKKEKGLGSSKFIGVSFSEKEGKWRSRVTENGKVNHIGRFKTEQEAINAIINYENKQLLPSPNGGILGF